MFLRKRSPGGSYYLYFLDSHGKRRCVSTRSTLKCDALKFLQTFKQSEHERKASLSSITLTAFTKVFLEHSRSVHTPKTVESNATALAEFLRITGNVPLQRITPRDIEGFLATKRREASAWTARKYYLALSSAFESAKRWGYVLANPFREVARPKPPEVQPVFFTVEEFRTLLSVIPDRDFSDLVQTAVMTGMRLGELLALEWTAIDFERAVVTVRNTRAFTTKSKRARVIPMHNELCRLLLARQARSCGASHLVFTTKGRAMTESCVSHRFKKAVRIAGLDDRLHFHSTRHAFASWLVQSGATLYEVQRLLGHSSPTVTEVYSHLQPEHLHGTVNRINVGLNPLE